MIRHGRFPADPRRQRRVAGDAFQRLLASTRSNPCPGGTTITNNRAFSPSNPTTQSGDNHSPYSATCFEKRSNNPFSSLGTRSTSSNNSYSSQSEYSTQFYPNKVNKHLSFDEKSHYQDHLINPETEQAHKLLEHIQNYIDQLLQQKTAEQENTEQKINDPQEDQLQKQPLEKDKKQLEVLNNELKKQINDLKEQMNNLKNKHNQLLDEKANQLKKIDKLNQENSELNQETNKLKNQQKIILAIGIILVIIIIIKKTPTQPQTTIYHIQPTEKNTIQYIYYHDL